MIVYKYLHPERIDVLSAGLIRFTQPVALNDPFEANPVLCEMRRFFERLHRDVAGVSLTADDLRGTQKAISESFGRWNPDNVSDLAFLSLSKERNNLLMWSHYCDSHRGLVVGFDSSDPFFSVPRPGVKSVLQQVTYSSHRPVMPTPDDNWDEFFRTKTNILTKSNWWAYEEELRMFASPDAADVRNPGPDGHELYLFSFPAESVREVILGYGMPRRTREAIVEIVRDRYGNAKLYEAALNESEYDLNIVAYRTAPPVQ